MERIKIGDIVKHFKREGLTEEQKATNEYLYKVLAFAEHTESGEHLVIYQALYENADMGVKLFEIFARPYDMFMSVVDSEKYPQIKSLYRMTKYS